MSDFDRRNDATLDGGLKRDDERLTPGKYTNTELLEGGSAPSPRVPGKRSGTEGLAVDAPEQLPDVVKSALSSEPGKPLADADKWSKRVGADVAHARIVKTTRGAQAAAAVNARAFTVGHRVFMAAGKDETTDAGHLLEHELTHVVQQRGAPAPSSWDALPVVAYGDS